VFVNGLDYWVYIVSDAAIVGCSALASGVLLLNCSSVDVALQRIATIKQSVGHGSSHYSVYQPHLHTRLVSRITNTDTSIRHLVFTSHTTSSTSLRSHCQSMLAVSTTFVEPFPTINRAVYQPQYHAKF
jgi:hypothetical protein